MTNQCTWCIPPGSGEDSREANGKCMSCGGSGKVTDNDCSCCSDDCDCGCFHKSEARGLPSHAGHKCRCIAVTPAPEPTQAPPAIPSSVYTPVLAFFDGDHDKTREWFRAFNPLLGMTPMDLIALGKVDRLKAFIETQLAENAPAMQDERCDKCGVDGSLYRSEFKAFDKALRDEVASHDRTRAALARCTQERDTYAQAAADRGEEAKAARNWYEQFDALLKHYRSMLGCKDGEDGPEKARQLVAKARGLELELAAERARGKRANEQYEEARKAIGKACRTIDQAADVIESLGDDDNECPGVRKQVERWCRQFNLSTEIRPALANHPEPANGKEESK